MDNGRKSINEIFNGCKFFSIPYYQRGYAWGDKQLLDFLRILTHNIILIIIIMEPFCCLIKIKVMKMNFLKLLTANKE